MNQDYSLTQLNVRTVVLGLEATGLNQRSAHSLLCHGSKRLFDSACFLCKQGLKADHPGNLEEKGISYLRFSQKRFFQKVFLYQSF